MKSKSQLILLNIFITVISIYFTYAVYIDYKQTLEQKVNNYIKKSVERNKKIIKNTFQKIKEEIEKDRKLFEKIHTEYTMKLRKNPQENLYILKEEILNKYNLKNREIHLFLLDKEYTITNSTYKPDIGFKLALVPDAKVELDKAKDGNIYQSKSVSIDIITSDVKSYSYSKINDNLYFEMGFINYNIHDILKVAMEKIRMITNEKSNLYRIEQKLDNTEYFDNVLLKQTTKSKEEYLKTREKFDKTIETSNLIIKSNRIGETLENITKDALIFYIPLIKKKNDYLELMGDFVLELYIDKTDDIALAKKIEIYYYIFLLFHIFFLFIIFFFTKKYHDSQILLNDKLKEKEKLLEENSNFITAIVEQIKTPLSIIMNNFAFIENFIDRKKTNYIEQINSSINMLQNSYDDLNYLTENKKLKYKTHKVNISKILNQRVSFFENIAKTQNKNISTNIENALFIEMNEVELERIIDNNISNAIKYGLTNTEIKIELLKENHYVIMRFYSYNEKILDKEKIFIRNYQENLNSKRSLGIGLSMVKTICEKYKIKYFVDYIEKQNVFIYKLSASMEN